MLKGRDPRASTVNAAVVAVAGTTLGKTVKQANWVEVIPFHNVPAQVTFLSFSSAAFGLKWEKIRKTKWLFV